MLYFGKFSPIHNQKILLHVKIHLKKLLGWYFISTLYVKILTKGNHNHQVKYFQWNIKEVTMVFPVNANNNCVKEQLQRKEKMLDGISCLPYPKIISVESTAIFTLEDMLN